MRRRCSVSTALAVVLCGTAVALVSADTLVMRDGRRIDGELVSVRNGTVEFRELGPRNGRLIRVSRDDVRRIDLDELGMRGRSGPGWSGGERYGGERSGGVREREAQVDANSPWTDTGIEVRAGDTVSFEARGQVTWGPGRQDGPQGERDSPYNAGRPIPNRPAAGLIGRIGSDVFFIGNDTGPMRMRSSGRLSLGVNDDYLQDNRGAFRVTVYY